MIFDRFLADLGMIFDDFFEIFARLLEDSGMFFLLIVCCCLLFLLMLASVFGSWGSVFKASVLKTLLGPPLSYYFCKPFPGNVLSIRRPTKNCNSDPIVSKYVVTHFAGRVPRLTKHFSKKT